MDYIERIKKMHSDGKLSENQYLLLSQALKESQSKTERVFKDVSDLKKKRTKLMSGLVFSWLLSVLVSGILILMLMMNNRLRIAEEKILKSEKTVQVSGGEAL